MSKNKAKSTSKLKNSIFGNLLFIFLSGAFLLFATLIALNMYTRQNKSVDVPPVKGLQLKEAKALLKSRGLNYVIVDSLYDRSAIPGSIIEQVPSANSRTKSGREVFLSVFSDNPPELAVPGLVDYSQRQAEALLVSIGFEQLSIEEVPSEYKGLVKAIEYKGRTLKPEEKIPAGSPLTIIVGSGIQTDSLNIDDDYLMSPEKEEPHIIEKKRKNSHSENNQHVDESFF